MGFDLELCHVFMASTDYVGGLFWVLKIIVLYENALSPIGRASVEHLVYSSSINIIIIKEYLFWITFLMDIAWSFDRGTVVTWYT